MRVTNTGYFKLFSGSGVRTRQTQSLWSNKRGQEFEIFMVFAAIVLLVAAMTSVLMVHSHLPSKPNLPAKTIMLTQQSFNTIEFYFQTAVIDAVANVHFAAPAKCQTAPQKAGDTDSIIAGYTLLSSACVDLNFVGQYQSSFSQALDQRLDSVDARVPGFESDYPKTFDVPLVGSAASSSGNPSEFIQGQFMIGLVNNPDNTISAVIVSRRPLFVHAVSPSLDTTKHSGEWTFDAQRPLFAKVQIPSADVQTYRLVMATDEIKSLSNVAISAAYANHLALKIDGDLTDAERAALIASIEAGINTDPKINFLKLLSQQSATDYYAYDIILEQNNMYAVFPNARMAILLYTFTGATQSTQNVAQNTMSSPDSQNS